MKEAPHAKGREELEVTSWWEYKTVPLFGNFLKS